MPNVTRSNVRRRINDASNFENYKNEEHRRSSEEGSSNATDSSVYITNNKKKERNITIIDSKSREARQYLCRYVIRYEFHILVAPYKH